MYKARCYVFVCVHSKHNQRIHFTLVFYFIDTSQSSKGGSLDNEKVHFMHLYKFECNTV